MAVYAPFTAGQALTADALNTFLIAETMEWTPLASLGAFSSGFSANATRVPMMRKIMRLGTEVWQFKGTINVTGTLTANTQFTAFTFTSSSNFVVSERERMNAATGASRYPVLLGWMATGIMTVSVPTAAGSGTTGFWIDTEIEDPMLLI